MFGSHYRSVRTDRSLFLASPMITALCQNGTAAEREALGATLTSWLPITDPVIYKDRGHPSVLTGELPLAAACARVGGIDLLKGLVTRNDFFERPPFRDGASRGEHSDATIAEAVIKESLAQGHFEIVDLVVAAAKKQKEALNHKKNQNWMDRYVDEVIQINDRSAKGMLYWLANAEHLTADQRSKGFEKIKSLCPTKGNYGSQVALADQVLGMWLSEAITSGEPESLASALALGAKPTPNHILYMTREGLFAQAAAEMKKGLETSKKKKSKHTWSGHEEDEDGEVDGFFIASRIAESLSTCMPYFIRGLTEWRDPSDEGRESTWYSFLKGRKGVHEGSILALQGAFDFESEDAQKIEASKDELASLARAVALIKTPEAPDVDPSEITKLRPNAPVTAAELSLLVHIEGDHFISALNAAAGDALNEWTEMLLKEHKSYKKDVLGRQSRQNDQRIAAMTKVYDQLDLALFELNDSANSRLSPKMQDAVNQYITQDLEVKINFEKRSIDRASRQGQQNAIDSGAVNPDAPKKKGLRKV